MKTFLFILFIGSEFPLLFFFPPGPLLESHFSAFSMDYRYRKPVKEIRFIHHGQIIRPVVAEAIASLYNNVYVACVYKDRCLEYLVVLEALNI